MAAITDPGSVMDAITYPQTCQPLTMAVSDTHRNVSHSHDNNSHLAIYYNDTSFYYYNYTRIKDNVGVIVSDLLRGVLPTELIRKSNDHDLTYRCAHTHSTTTWQYFCLQSHHVETLEASTYTTQYTNEGYT